MGLSDNNRIIMGIYTSLNSTLVECVMYFGNDCVFTKQLVEQLMNGALQYCIKLRITTTIINVMLTH